MATEKLVKYMEYSKIEEENSSQSDRQVSLHDRRWPEGAMETVPLKESPSCTAPATNHCHRQAGAHTGYGDPYPDLGILRYGVAGFA